MFAGIAKKIFGSVNDRQVKKLLARAEKISALEPQYEALSDDDLKACTARFRERLANGETLDDVMNEAFAVVREASKRTLGLRHFDVQMAGGMILHEGIIAEMATGEGKTLTATLPVYLNAIEGKGAHVVTVNDYLAKRDAEDMGQIYGFLGLTTGAIVPGMDDDDRRVAYACDVTYGTNNELGFDYLRDNMKFRLDSMVQRDFNFGIVDEVDSILIDEARTPLIISGPAENSSDLYRDVDKVMPGMVEADYDMDEKARSINMTEEGIEHAEALLVEAGLMEQDSTLYDMHNIALLHHINSALRAHKLFTKDKDYMVRNDEIVIIDEFSGRAMEGRRFSEGLHQALEAKEGVSIQAENHTLASITFQNFFRLYPKLAGMTGTALTEAGEFSEIYNLEVTAVPTNEPMIRIDEDDKVFRTEQEKYKAIVDEIVEASKKQQPVLVGTVSIEKSEFLAGELTKHGIKHSVLNARFHEQEANIIAEAGVPGSVTIATNMAGRGTDIQLGGNLAKQIENEVSEDDSDQVKAEKTAKIKADIAERRKQVLEAGGLYVIGTERHESRRIDNQLRGRSGRQGDPGRTQFFLSLQDDLMRIFGSDRMDSMLQKLGLEEGEAIVHTWINKAIAKAQTKVEGRNFEIRKNLLKYDDVMNDQRKVIYEQRRDIMKADDVSETVTDMRHQAIEDAITVHIPAGSYPEQWNTTGLETSIEELLGLGLPVAEWAAEEGVADEELYDRIVAEADKHMARKAANFGPETMRLAEKSILLQILDQQWKEHLLLVIQLRDGIGLRAIGQRNPLNEYKQESFALFEELLGNIRKTVCVVINRIELQSAEEMDYPDDDDIPSPETIEPAQPFRNQAADEINPNDSSTWGKVPRNAPCPCGSGKKFKKCHGAVS
jgi:preprotein translocase subunit SecA